MKRYNTPELKVKEFSRVSILTVSAPTNSDVAKKELIKSGVKPEDVAKIVL